MRMNVFEMEGFLRGKCVPRDLKVNETNAEYLLRKFDALEAKCAALENKIIPVSWDMTLGWIVWQQRAGIHFSTMTQQEVK